MINIRFIIAILIVMGASYIIYGILSMEPFRIWIGILHFVLSWALSYPGSGTGIFRGSG